MGLSSGALGAVAVVAAAWLIALSGYDLRLRRLPNWLTVPGAVLILVGATLRVNKSTNPLAAAER